MNKSVFHDVNYLEPNLTKRLINVFCQLTAHLIVVLLNISPALSTDPGHEYLITSVGSDLKADAGTTPLTPDDINVACYWPRYRYWELKGGK